MSTGFAAVPNWLVEEPSISAHEKLVYLALSSKIGDQGVWFISHAQIGAMAGISASSVKRALASLRDRGVVTWEGRVDEATGAKLGNSYRLMTDRLGQSDMSPRSERHTPQVSVTEQNKNPEKEPRTINISAPAVRSQEIDVLFEQFWRAWPLKKGKKEARVAFGKAIKRAPIEQILHGVENYVREIGPTPDWSKVKWPQGWLNGERWEDEPIATGTSREQQQAAARQAMIERYRQEEGSL